MIAKKYYYNILLLKLILLIAKEKNIFFSHSLSEAYIELCLMLFSSLFYRDFLYFTCKYIIFKYFCIFLPYLI